VSRFLFVMPPLAGHVNPAAGVADELGRRGHAVAWAGDVTTLTSLLPPLTTIHPCATPSVPERPADLRGFGAMKFLWETLLVPLAEAMVPGVEQALALEQPDVVVVDQQAFAGAVVAERAGVPWVTSASTSAELADPLAAMPKARQWVTEQLDGLRQQFGNPYLAGDLRFSPYLVLGYTTGALLNGQTLAAERTALVGPVQRPVQTNGGFAVGEGDGPLVYVSMGTVNAEASGRFLRECVDALRERPHLRAVVADPGGAITDAPDHVIVRPNVPQLAVLEQASAVICHAGHNTVSEALARSVPLVVAPIRDDQPIVAQQVVDSGAGVSLRFTHARAGHIGAAVDQVLGEPGFAKAAAQVGDSFRAAGGASAAADHIEAIAHR
jgi:MGT family glycosyltransferase